MRADVWVTTSWDDGHRLDPVLAELLTSYGLTGTFYVAPRIRELAPADRLAATDLRELAETFEIGGHTLTHPRLTEVPAATAAEEIRSGKTALEEIIGREVVSFAYPGGRFAEAHATQVAQAGFRMARTVRRFVTGEPDDPFAVDTTVHAYRHWSDLHRIAWHARWRPARLVERFAGWDALAIAMFDEVLSRGGVFHLWGHVWEIDTRSDWDRLKRVCAHIGGRPDVRYVTNCELPGITAAPGVPA